MNCSCGTRIHPRRVALGYHLCPVCGDRAARLVKYTTAPLNKSNYVLITNTRELKMLNPKYNNA